jgi:hypothetical protein
MNITTKRVARYVHGTLEEDFWLTGFTNSDWASSVDDRKSTTGYVFIIG